MTKRMGAAAALTLTVTVVSLVGCASSKKLPAPDKRFDKAKRASAASPGSDSLRVMSFNLRTSTIFDLFNTWGLRKALLVDTIHAYRPDLLGTQECRAQQARYLREKLPGYRFVGVGRNDGEDSGEMMGVFYRKRAFTEVARGHFWLSRTPEEAGSKSWDTLFPRMVTWVKLRPRDRRQAFYFFNTHFSAFGDEARRASARLLRRRIARRAGEAPVIVTGDFNADAGSRPHAVLTDRSAPPALKDTFRAVHADGFVDAGTLHGFDGRANDQRIDWILSSADFTPRHAGIDRSHDDGRYPSDHFPVTAVLDWPRAVAQKEAPAEDAG